MRLLMLLLLTAPLLAETPTVEELDAMLEERLHFDEHGRLKPSAPTRRAASIELDTIAGTQIRLADLGEPALALKRRPEVGLRWVALKSPGGNIRGGPQITSGSLGFGIGFRFVPVVQLTIGPALVWDPVDRAVRIGVYGGVLKF